MKNLLLGGFLLFCTSAFATPCLPGSLQDYINLGGTGCDVNNVQFFNFEIAPGQSFATPIAPDSVQVTPGGGQFTPTLSLGLNSSATAGQLFELFFRFNTAAGTLIGSSISLGSPVVTGDGAVLGILDVCAGGSFPNAPLGCSGTAASTATFAIASDSLLSSSVNLPVSSFFDVFVDLSIDGGLSGTATLDSAAVSATTPEPSTLLLMAAALGGLGIVKARRRF